MSKVVDKSKAHRTLADFFIVKYFSALSWISSRYKIVGNHHTLADKIRQNVGKSNNSKLPDFVVGDKNRHSPDKKSAIFFLKLDSTFWVAYAQVCSQNFVPNHGLISYARIPY